MSNKTECCALAKKLGPHRTVDLNAELRRTNHRSYRKLAVELQVRHGAIERHKKNCLKLCEPSTKEVKAFVVPDMAGVPEVSHVSRGTDETLDGTDGTPATPADGSAPRAPARVPGNASEVRRIRRLAITSAMADGTWDTPRDNVAKRAAEWGLSVHTVADIVREAAAAAEVDPETVKARRAVALGRWGWGVQKARDAIEAGPEGVDTMSKLLSAYAQMQSGWDKAAGVLDDSVKVQINVTTHPIFVELMGAVMATLRGFPEARARVTAMLRDKATMLQQPPIDVDAVVVNSEGETT